MILQLKTCYKVANTLQLQKGSDRVDSAIKPKLFSNCHTNWLNSIRINLPPKKRWISLYPYSAWPCLVWLCVGTLTFVSVEFTGWGNRPLGGKMWTCRNVSIYTSTNHLIKKDNSVRILSSCIGGVFILWTVMDSKEYISFFKI